MKNGNKGIEETTQLGENITLTHIYMGFCLPFSDKKMIIMITVKIVDT